VDQVASASVAGLFFNGCTSNLAHRCSWWWGVLFCKVITGLMRRPDREAVSNLPVGIIPLGSANMFASTLHSGECDSDSDSSSEGLAGWAALTVALQKTRKVDVLELTTHDGNTVYALSAIGWGAPGTMAVHAEKQAWLKSHRYWYGAAMGLLTEDTESVASCKARVAYPKGTNAAPVFVRVRPTYHAACCVAVAPLLSRLHGDVLMVMGRVRLGGMQRQATRLSSGREQWTTGLGGCSVIWMSPHSSRQRCQPLQSAAASTRTRG
jgi:hypothetical protein